MLGNLNQVSIGCNIQSSTQALQFHSKVSTEVYSLLADRSLQDSHGISHSRQDSLVGMEQLSVSQEVVRRFKGSIAMAESRRNRGNHGWYDHLHYLACLKQWLCI